MKNSQIKKISARAEKELIRETNVKLSNEIDSSALAKEIVNKFIDRIEVFTKFKIEVVFKYKKLQ